MEPEGSLPHSQVPATYPCPEPARSCPTPSWVVLCHHGMARRHFAYGGTASIMEASGEYIE